MRGWAKVNQLTVRGFDDDLGEALRQLAQREGISLNQAAIKLLRQGAGLCEGEPASDKVGCSLDHLIGSWTASEAAEMDAALADFESVDKAMWE